MKKKELILVVCLWIFLYISLLPYLKAGFYADDTWGSLYRVVYPQDALQALKQILSDIKDSFFYNRRGNYFDALEIIPIYFFPKSEDHKFIKITLTIIDLFLLARICFRMGLSKSSTFLGVFITPVFIQFGFNPNPFYSGLTLLQALGFFVLFSMDRLVVSIKSEKLQFFNFLMSILSIFIALGYYELSFSFVFAFLWLALYLVDFKLKKNLKFILVCCLPFALFVLRQAYFTYYFPHDYQGTKFGLIQEVPLTLLKQLSASIPFISYLFVRSPTLSVGDFFSKKNFVFFTLSFFLVTTIFLLFKNEARNRKLQPKILLIFLFLMTVPPAGMIALSTKYQKWIRWGDGYLPQFFSSLAFPFLFVLTSSLIIEKICWRSSRVKNLFIFFASFLCASAVVANRTIIERTFNEVEGWRPREMLQLAIQGGFLDEMKNGDTLVTDRTYAHLKSDFFYLNAGKRIHVTTLDTAFRGPLPEQPKNSQLFVLETFEKSSTQWGYLLTKLRPNEKVLKQTQTKMDYKALCGTPLEDVTFYGSAHLEPYFTSSGTGENLPRVLSLPVQDLMIEPSTMRRLYSGSHARVLMTTAHQSARRWKFCEIKLNAFRKEKDLQF